MRAGTRIGYLAYFFAVATIFIGCAAGFAHPAAARANNFHRLIVTFDNEKTPIGSIIVVNSERRLYYTLGNGRAIRYPIAIGDTRGAQWTGVSIKAIEAL